MTDAVRTSALAGLVSAEAERLYRRLRAVGALRNNDADVRVESPALAELLTRGVAFRHGDEIRPVDPAAALRILIAARQDEMLDAQSRILDGWSRLSKMLPSALDNSTGGLSDGVRVLTRIEEVVTHTAELCAVATRRLRAMEAGSPPARTGAVHRPSAPPDGADYQVLYDCDHLTSDAGVRLVERSVAAGQQVRLRSRMPITMLHVDDNVALVTTDHAAPTALLVQSPALLEVLADWFDLLWHHPTTMTYPVGGADSVLTAPQRDILKLMLGGGGDDAIARRLSLSVTTVRRHIKSIYLLLGVNNRFAAGMAAAKQNWI
jgi:DNA-binding CsgD family transcriptional regulator